MEAEGCCVWCLREEEDLGVALQPVSSSLGMLPRCFVRVCVSCGFATRK